MPLILIHLIILSKAASNCHYETILYLQYISMIIPSLEMRKNCFLMRGSGIYFLYG